MITLTEISFENLGPYRSRQQVDLQSPVTIVQGNNGSGKTSLFRALRFAIYGEVDIDLADLIHRGGGKRMSTRVVVEVGVAPSVTEYEISRTFDRADASTTLHVLEDGSVLAENAAREVVQRLFPKDLADFVFFETEKLRQYQSKHGSRSGQMEATREAIEKILGLPLLGQAADAIDDVRRKADGDLRKYKQSEEFEQIQHSLNLARINSDAVKSDLKQARTSRNECFDEMGGIERSLAEYEVFRKYLEDTQTLNGQLVEVTKSRDEYRNRLAAHASQAWIIVAGRHLSAARRDLRVRQTELAGILGRKSVYDDQLRHFDQSDKCPTCQSHLGPPERNAVQERLRHDIDSVDPDAAAKEITGVGADLAHLDRLLESDPTDDVRTASEGVLRCDVRIAELEAEIKRKKAAMDSTGLSDGQYGELIARRTSLTARIEAIEVQAGKAERDLAERETAITKLENELLRAVGSDAPPALVQTLELSKALDELFKIAGSKARDLVRQRIQERATQFFRSVSAIDPGRKVVLDGAFRASVVGADGGPVPGLSAGYEQLLVLSLVSAFMQTSPTPGPVLMDMPFGRLDAERTADVIQALPGLSHQVLIFVFPGEFADRDLDRLNSKPSLYSIDFDLDTEESEIVVGRGVRRSE